MARDARMGEKFVEVKQGVYFDPQGMDKRGTYVKFSTKILGNFGFNPGHYGEREAGSQKLAAADAWRHARFYEWLSAMKKMPPGMKTEIYDEHENGTGQPVFGIRVEMPALLENKDKNAEMERRIAEFRKLLAGLRLDHDVTMAKNWGRHEDGQLYYHDLDVVHGGLRGKAFLPPEWQSPDGKVPTLASASEMMTAIESVKISMGRKQ